jgi:(1->4)-alpha-D-glucan 1-alpha-D-glucosylmutase
VHRFVDAILNPHRPFMAAFRPFQQRVAETGIYNSLAQLVLKTTAPGVPDFYQGTELWDLSLVDPDNRRPVDYDRRRALLADLVTANGGGALLRDLIEKRRCGLVKLFTMLRALQARRAHERLFASGGYVPLATTGAHGESLFAFARSNEEELAITCVPRLIATLVGDAGRPPLGADIWGDTAVQLPAAAAGVTLCDVFTGRQVVPHGAATGTTLPASDLFTEFPVALLVSDRTSPRA